MMMLYASTAATRREVGFANYKLGLPLRAMQFVSRNSYLPSIGCSILSHSALNVTGQTKPSSRLTFMCILISPVSGSLPSHAQKLSKISCVSPSAQTERCGIVKAQNLALLTFTVKISAPEKLVDPSSAPSKLEYSILEFVKSAALKILFLNSTLPKKEFEKSAKYKLVPKKTNCIFASRKSLIFSSVIQKS